MDNLFDVAEAGGSVLVGRLGKSGEGPLVLTRDEALNLAVWLAFAADPNLERFRALANEVAADDPD